MIKNDNLQAIEKWGFRIILFLHLLPVLLLTPFVTLDGPAHLYNSVLIRELLSTQSYNIISQPHFFLQFNAFPEPNWTGHFIMSLLTFILPVLMVEKVMLLAVLLLTAFGYRKLIRSFQSDSLLNSWMLFPFLFNFVFCLGFINYSLAFALFPFALSWWINNRNNFNFKNVLIGFCWLALIYFSHLVIFLFTVIAMGLYTLSHWRKLNGDFWKEIKFLSIFSLPWILFSGLFVWLSGANGYRGEVSYLPFMDLIQQIIESRIFIVYNYDDENGLTLIYSFFILLALVWTFIERKKIRLQLFPILLMIVSLLMIFVLPDSLASGGILSIRIIQLFFICLIFWLASVESSKIKSITMAIFSVGFSSMMLFHHYPTQKGLSDDAHSFIEAGKQLQDSNLIMPLNYSPNWMHANMCSYMGAVSKAMVLDNYEPTQGHFPLVWKESKNPEKALGNYTSSNHPCVQLANFENTFRRKITTVSVWKKENSNPEDSCDKSVNALLNEQFKVTYQDNNIQLLTRKK
ncbi:MAG: hypothetical protein RL516_2112 [Bacteroidota bacterium]|jgi:hypothetical protein